MTRKSVWIALTFLQTAAAVCCRADDISLGEVSFNRDVMGVLAKAGCNQGVCHGNQNGKGGFKLSLRGQDPRADFAAITRDQLGRRVDTVLPERSLLLAKPTADVPHQGGRRFKVGSAEYEILRRWIAAGCPADPPGGPTLARLEVTPAAEQILIEPSGSVRLAVAAIFSDGTRRDVTTRAVYEPTNTLVAVDHDGLVQGLAAGETTVLVRYLDQQVAVRLAIVPPRPNFVFQA